MKVIIRNNAKEGGIWAAHYIAAKIKEKAARTSKPFVLGLPTGSTPLNTYAELARMVQAGEVSFKNVITFNMDEYVGLPEEHPEISHFAIRSTTHDGMTKRYVEVFAFPQTLHRIHHALARTFTKQRCCDIPFFAQFTSAFQKDKPIDTTFRDDPAFYSRQSISHFKENIHVAFSVLI